MLRVEAAGYPVVLTVHDEIVSEAADRDIKEFQTLVETNPVWATGFPITAKAWTGPRYRKD
jgi:DNA polymerase